MARVVRARDIVLDRWVAVKLLPGGVLDPTARERFRREARSSAAFNHPNAVAVFDAGEDGGQLFLVMELVDGPSLAAVLAERGPPPPRRGAAHRGRRPRRAGRRPRRRPRPPGRQAGQRAARTERPGQARRLRHRPPPRRPRPRPHGRPHRPRHPALHVARTARRPACDRRRAISTPSASCCSRCSSGPRPTAVLRRPSSPRPTTRRRSPTSRRAARRAARVASAVTRALAKDPAARFPSAAAIARRAGVAHDRLPGRRRGARSALDPPDGPRPSELVVGARRRRC